MNRSAINALIQQGYAREISKQQIFEQLCSASIPPATAAHAISHMVNPVIYRRYRGYVWWVRGLGVLQAMVAVLAGFWIGRGMGDGVTTVLIMLAMGIVPAALAYGFFRNHILPYNAMLVFLAMEAANLIMHFESAARQISLLLLLILLCFMLLLYVRWRLFPEIRWFVPKRVHGHYQFVD
ncbi:hypothetical protein [Celerinatantimonas yamalensis]|uniref:DUF2157 domain-containing protein n=1 Tax=Celerinatantimonas yamalensis TaxID=559956 RepID=A0ABW9G328_9GAMM